MQITIARCELIAEDVKGPEIYLVGPVCIRRVAVRSDIRCVVVEQVENIVAFMFMGANDLRVDRHMVGDQRIGTDTFVEAKILWRIPGIDRIYLGFDTFKGRTYLVIAGMLNTVAIVPGVVVL